MRKPKLYLTIRLLLLLLTASLGQLQVSAQNIEFIKQNFPDKKEEFKLALKALNAGDDSYKRGKPGYAQALENYLKAYAFNPKNADLNFKIGMCYLGSVNKPIAASYLESAMQLDPEVDPQIQYKLARAYHYNLQFDEAIQAYIRCKAMVSEMEADDALPDLLKKIEECKQGKTMVDNPVRCLIDNLGPKVNSPYADHSPVVSADESVLVFSSRRPTTTGGDIDPTDGDYFEDIMISYKQDGAWTEAQNIGTQINGTEHDAAIGMSPDGQKLFSYKGDNGGDIYLSELKGDVWSKPVRMDNIINTKYHESSACFSNDYKTIYFTSDRPDQSLGGRDIYYSKLNKKGKWSEPVNMGSVINTKYDEEGVFMHPDGKHLYFSSKGQGTMGGYDVFKSTWNDVTQSWGTPENIGYPINTPDDDVYFVVSASGKHGYFTSYQKEGYGANDLYLVTFLGPEKPFLLSTEENLLASIAAPVSEKQVQAEVALTTNLTIVKGRTMDAASMQPVEAAIDIVDNSTNEIITTVLSNSQSGKYLVTLPSGKNYGIAVSADGYLFHSENFDIPASQDYQELSKDVLLKRVEIGTTITLKNIFFEFNKAALTSESTYELENLIKLLNDNPKMRIELGSHTDNKGNAEYNLKLSESRSKSVVDYLIAHGIDAGRLLAKGYGMSQPVAPNSMPDGSDNPEGRQLNRRTDFKIIAK